MADLAAMSFAATDLVAALEATTDTLLAAAGFVATGLTDDFVEDAFDAPELLPAETWEA